MGRERTIGLKSEAVKINLDEPFSVVPVEKHYSYKSVNIYGIDGVSFETNSGIIGVVNFPNYEYGFPPGGVPTPAGSVEIRQTITSTGSGNVTRDYSYPVTPIIQLKIDSERLGIIHDDSIPLDEPGRSFFDTRKREFGEALVIARSQVEFFMIFGNKTYRGLVSLGNHGMVRAPEMEWDKQKGKRSAFASIKAVDWIDLQDDQRRHLWPLFPPDPDVLSKIQFIIRHKPDLANGAILSATRTLGR